MSLNNNKIEEIKEANDIVSVISEYIHLEKSGANYKALCPFHHEKTPSFIVSPSLQIFKCFGCGRSGDVIKFVQDYEGITFYEALSQLAKRVGIKLDDSFSKEGEDKEPLYKAMEIAFNLYRKYINEKEVKDYLKERDIDYQTVERFQLCYVPTWEVLSSYVKRKGKDIKPFIKAGLLRQRDDGQLYDFFGRRLLFPIFDKSGRIVAFGGRTIDGKEPKYLNSPNTPIYNKGFLLYGFNVAKSAAKERGEMIIVEGYMDVISMHRYGFTNTVAPLGTSLTSNQATIVSRLVSSVKLLFDNDDSGRKATIRAIPMFYKNGIDPYVVILRDAKDPDEVLKHAGKEMMQRFMDESLPSYIFIADMINNMYSSDDMSAKVKKIKMVKEIVSEITDEDWRNVFIEKISDYLGISKSHLSLDTKVDPVQRPKSYHSLNLKEKATMNILSLMSISDAIYNKKEDILYFMVDDDIYQIITSSNNRKEMIEMLDNSTKDIVIELSLMFERRYCSKNSDDEEEKKKMEEDLMFEFYSNIAALLRYYLREETERIKRNIKNGKEEDLMKLSYYTKFQRDLLSSVNKTCNDLILSIEEISEEISKMGELT